jgi:hypothetical protein
MSLRNDFEEIFTKLKGIVDEDLPAVRDGIDTVDNVAHDGIATAVEDAFLTATEKDDVLRVLDLLTTKVNGLNVASSPPAPVAAPVAEAPVSPPPVPSATDARPVL